MGRCQMNVPGRDVGDDAWLPWLCRLLTRHRAKMLLQSRTHQPFDQVAIDSKVRHFHRHGGAHERDSLVVSAITNFTPVFSSHAFASLVRPASTIKPLTAFTGQS